MASPEESVTWSIPCEIKLDIKVGSVSITVDWKGQISFIEDGITSIKTTKEEGENDNVEGIPYDITLYIKFGPVSHTFHWSGVIPLKEDGTTSLTKTKEDGEDKE